MQRVVKGSCMGAQLALLLFSHPVVKDPSGRSNTLHHALQHKAMCEMSNYAQLCFSSCRNTRMCKVVNRKETQPQTGVALLTATGSVTLITVVSHPAAYVNSNARVAANSVPDL